MSTTHSLRYNGVAHTITGQLINDDTTVTSGVGSAKCSCGWVGVQLDTGAARRRDFKQHKAAAAETPAAPVEEPMFTDEEMTDLGVSAEDVAQAEANVQELVEGYAAPATYEEALADQTSISIPFTTEVADSMWRFLGRAAVPVIEGLYRDTVATADNNAHAIILTGPRAHMEDAEGVVQQFWAEAIAAVKEWKKTDEAWLARPKGGLAGRKASYFMTGEFYTGYAATFVAAMDY